MNDEAHKKMELSLSRAGRSTRFDISQVCPNGFSYDIITL